MIASHLVDDATHDPSDDLAEAYEQDRAIAEGAADTAPASVTESVARFRRAASALRRLHQFGGTTAATSSAIARHESARRVALAALDGDRWLLGALADEDHPLGNIAKRRAAGAGYAELGARLAGVRRAIRSLLASEQVR